MLRNYNARAENGRVAQMVEQLTFNQLVAGSIPAAVTLLESFVANSYRGFVLLEPTHTQIKIYCKYTVGFKIGVSWCCGDWVGYHIKDVLPEDQ